MTLGKVRKLYFESADNDPVEKVIYENSANSVVNCVKNESGEIIYYNPYIFFDAEEGIDTLQIDSAPQYAYEVPFANCEVVAMYKDEHNRLVFSVSATSPSYDEKYGSTYKCCNCFKIDAKELKKYLYDTLSIKCNSYCTYTNWGKGVSANNTSIKIGMSPTKATPLLNSYSSTISTQEISIDYSESPYYLYIVVECDISQKSGGSMFSYAQCNFKLTIDNFTATLSQQ